MTIETKKELLTNACEFFNEDPENHLYVENDVYVFRAGSALFVCVDVDTLLTSSDKLERPLLLTSFDPQLIDNACNFFNDNPASFMYFEESVFVFRSGSALFVGRKIEIYLSTGDQLAGPLTVPAERI